MALVVFRNVKLVLSLFQGSADITEVQCLITPLHCETNFVPSEEEERLILKDKCSLLRLSVDAFEKGQGNGKRNKLNTQPEATHQSHTSEVFGKCCDRSVFGECLTYTFFSK